MVSALVRRIHEFLHAAPSGSEMVITISGDRHRLLVREMKTGQKYMEYQNTIFMEQSMLMPTLYASMAKTGAKITWGMKAGTKEPVFKIVNNFLYYDGIKQDLVTGKSTPIKQL